MPSAMKRARQLLHAMGCMERVHMHARAYSARAPLVQVMHMQQLSAHGAECRGGTPQSQLRAGTAGRGGVLPNLLFYAFAWTLSPRPIGVWLKPHQSIVA
eukprot:14943813-Alexandrium_andersonii.AAC.1